jgi:hypothetical protein
MSRMATGRQSMDAQASRIRGTSVLTHGQCVEHVAQHQSVARFNQLPPTLHIPQPPLHPRRTMGPLDELSCRCQPGAGQRWGALGREPAATRLAGCHGSGTTAVCNASPCSPASGGWPAGNDRTRAQESKDFWLQQLSTDWSGQEFRNAQIRSGSRAMSQPSWGQSSTSLLQAERCRPWQLQFFPPSSMTLT